MAQTKTKSTSKPTRKRPKGKPGKARARSSNSAKRSTAKKAASSRSKSQSRKARGAVEQAVESKGKDAGQAVRRARKAVGKARTPLIATGAAAVAGASGLAIGAMQHRQHNGSGSLGKKMQRKAAKIKPEDVAMTMRKAARFTENAGQIAGELRRASEGSSGNGKRPSPIEVVLRGLTSRQP